MSEQDNKPLDLDTLRKVCENATAGPWEIVRHGNANATVYFEAPKDPTIPNSTAFAITGGTRFEKTYEANLEFICQARTDVPRLLDLVESQQREIERIRAVVERQTTYARPTEGWVCFHCGERFINPKDAAAHFGKTPADVEQLRQRIDTLENEHLNLIEAEGKHLEHIAQLEVGLVLTAEKINEACFAYAAGLEKDPDKGERIPMQAALLAVGFHEPESRT